MAIEKIIATDLDGTLFYPKKVVRMVSKKAHRFIDRFTDDGGRLVLVSGRSRFSCEKLVKRLGKPLDFIACNGACIVSNGALIRDITFDAQSVKEMIETAEKDYPVTMAIIFTKHRGMVIRRSELTRLTTMGYNLYMFMQFNYRELFVCSDRVFYEELEKGEIYKVMFMFGASKRKSPVAKKSSESLAERYPGFSVAWSSQVVEVTPKGCDKKEGLLFYLDYNQYKHDNVIVVGDSGNDIPMFDAFPKDSFCMAHSPASVQSHSAYIIDRFHDLEDYIYPSEEKKASKKKMEKEGN